MTREEAYASCPSDSYVEFYADQWLVVPLAPVEQPSFFTCLPAGGWRSAETVRHLTSRPGGQTGLFPGTRRRPRPLRPRHTH